LFSQQNFVSLQIQRYGSYLFSFMIAKKLPHSDARLNNNILTILNTKLRFSAL